MPRVLVLAYYFPPHGGAGVQRTVKFLKHLPALGYDALVVTGPAETRLSWAPSDDTFAADIPAATEVLRVDGPEPGPSSGWRGRAERWLRRASPFSRWWIEGATALGLRTEGEFDLVYASMSPFETAEAACRISEATGKPWIADLRDPWALDEWTLYPSAIHRRLDQRSMGRLLGRAAAVVLNAPEATRAFRDRFAALPRLVETIPNGWDRDDFGGPPPVREDDLFRIVSVGYAHVDAGRRHRRTRLLRASLGGGKPGLDVLARSHHYLLEALDRVLGERPQLRSQLELHVAGAHAAESGEQAAHSLVRAHGYLPHPEAVALMRSADLLFLPMHDLPPGTRARTVPGKTYEYLAARRPLLAALPDGDARDLVSSWPEAHVCRPRDVDCLATVVRQRLELPRLREEVDVPSKLDAFERGELTRRLVELFDEVRGR